MAPAPTVLSLKQQFISTQTRLLSQSLSPSRSWRNANEAAEHALSERVIDDALFRLNHALHQHAWCTYPPQATRHVAEQIDQLYWSAGERTADHVSEVAAEGVSMSLDLGN
jgi:hypothetical protein